MLKKTIIYFVSIFFLLLANLNAKEIGLLCKIDDNIRILGGKSYSYIIDDRKNTVFDNDKKITHDLKKNEYTVFWQTQSGVLNSITEWFYELNYFTGQFEVYTKNYQKEDLKNKDKISKMKFKSLYSGICEKKEKLLD